MILVDNMSKRGFDPLTYRFQDQAPGPGEITEVKDGVYWIRMPMWGRLNHINVWLLRDGPGWTIVDTGLFRDDVQAHWETIFDKYLEGKPVTRVIATHLHADHTGNAGWITDKWDCELWMSRSDFYMCKVMAADGPSDVPQDAIRFYQRAGFTEQRLDRYRERFGQFGANIAPLPAGYRRIQDGQYIEIGGREWRAVMGYGHAPEHVCLYCPELKVIIAGDQILPRITPNISVQPSEPLANPLRDFLNSCAHIRDQLPPNLLVLPAHESLYEGVHERLTALIDWHEVALEKLYDLCETPKRAVDVFPALFKSEITDMSFFPATGEAIAHLHCALDRRMLTCEEDEHGVAWWRQA
ncbi:MAG: glyoxylase-like metal-dependent hydrolase (beta-lactamase superfamily II) [Candidatus Azotimanducaceae bacterium]|jgi:glyoxylase-like metal-dependent hydrolase (beta-lactamase superfamily II)